MKKLGRYIVVEGHDGTGKSTQVQLIRDKLRELGIESIEYHEPEGTPMAGAIRTLIKDGELERDGTTNLMLFSASRHDIWFKKALPALRDGVWVVASRNYYSTLAYQGHGEGLDLELISTVTRAATDDQYLHPDVSIILDMDDETERERRISSRGVLAKPDTFESKDHGFQKRVRDGYLDIAKTHAIPIVSASGTPDEIFDELWKYIKPYIQ